MRTIWWLTAVVSAGLVSIILSNARALDPFENFSLRITSPLENGMRDLADPISDFVEGITDRGDLVRENEKLRQENEDLTQLLAERENARERVSELEEALGVKESRPEAEFQVTNVISQDPSALKELIAIDRGSGDGLDEGMVVLSRHGTLIGTVSRAYEDFAWVRLVTDPDSAVNAQVHISEPSGDETDDAQGVVIGDLRQGLVLDLLPPDADVSEGSLVTTSGLGGNYPQGWVIGRVASVDERPQAPFKKARIESLADLASLETVMVITNFQPARLAGP
jgi:rod shape-determining protein MreC